MSGSYHDLRPGALALALAFVALGAACSGQPSAPTAGMNEQIVLAVGETVRVMDARLSLRFDGVNGDSRCPGDAICLVGGDAIVGVTVTPFVGQPARYELHTGGPASVRHDAVTVTVEQLSPYPFSSRPIDPATYQATLRVTR